MSSRHTPLFSFCTSSFFFNSKAFFFFWHRRRAVSRSNFLLMFRNAIKSLLIMIGITQGRVLVASVRRAESRSWGLFWGRWQGRQRVWTSSRPFKPTSAGTSMDFELPFSCDGRRDDSNLLHLHPVEHIHQNDTDNANFGCLGTAKMDVIRLETGQISHVSFSPPRQLALKLPSP